MLPPVGDCEVWFEVDFGRGLVELRCTQSGKHAQHRTEVFGPSSSGLQHRNVFENRETD